MKKGFQLNRFQAVRTQESITTAWVLSNFKPEILNSKTLMIGRFFIIFISETIDKLCSSEGVSSWVFDIHKSWDLVQAVVISFSINVEITIS